MRKAPRICGAFLLRARTVASYTRQRRESDAAARDSSESPFPVVEVTSTAVRSTAIRKRSEMRSQKVRSFVRMNLLTRHGALLTNARSPQWETANETERRSNS